VLATFHPGRARDIQRPGKVKQNKKGREAEGRRQRHQENLITAPAPERKPKAQQ
jgi:hypothetical protein